MQSELALDVSSQTRTQASGAYGRGVVPDRWVGEYLSARNHGDGFFQSGRILEGAIYMYMTTIMKVISDCNLACSYCYDLPRQIRSHARIMNMEVLERSIFQVLTNSPRKAQFIWHGGEPLLRGKDFFAAAVELQRKYKKPDQEIENGIQTNGLLLDNGWVDFFEENAFGIGVSLDGPEIYHDLYRVSSNGNGSFGGVLSAIELLVERKVKFGVLCVLTRESIVSADELYSFFRKIGVKSFDFLPLMESALHSSVTVKDFGTFMCTVFDRWFQDNDPEIRIRFFENALEGILGGSPGLCFFAGTCSSFITVDVNGDVYPCDNLAPFWEFRFGNLISESLDTILLNSRFQRFQASVNLHNPQCSKCRYLKICYSGCTFERYVSNGNISAKTRLCSAHKRIFSHIEKKVVSMIDEFDQRHRVQISSKT